VPDRPPLALEADDAIGDRNLGDLGEDHADRRGRALAADHRAEEGLEAEAVPRVQPAIGAYEPNIGGGLGTAG
jgi:hypothetical protein